MENARFEFLLRLGDNNLVLGHRVSEWCGHAPTLEDDIALANVALDLIGQTQLWLGLAAEVEGKARSADDLAFRRDVWEFRNLLLVEQPNTDFAHTLMRQFLFDAYQLNLMSGLCNSSDERIAEIATKALKEVTYHFDRSSSVVVALGDGTDESHARMQAALEHLWPFCGEMFTADEVDDAMTSAALSPDLALLKAQWTELVVEKLTLATLAIPRSNFVQLGGKSGARHTEHLGHLLATMQFLPRAYPDATW